jgi:hypothetical protein
MNEKGAPVQIPQMGSQHPINPPVLLKPELPSRSDGWVAFNSLLQEARVESEVSQTPKASQSAANADAKLTELMMAQTLRDVLPKTGSHGGSLALDTWRGLFADVLAEKISKAMPDIIKVSVSDDA